MLLACFLARMPQREGEKGRGTAPCIGDAAPHPPCPVGKGRMFLLIAPGDAPLLLLAPSPLPPPLARLGETSARHRGRAVFCPSDGPRQLHANRDDVSAAGCKRPQQGYIDAGPDPCLEGLGTTPYRLQSSFIW